MGCGELSPHSVHLFTGHTDIEEDVDIDGQIETLHTPSQYNATAATFRHDFDRVSPAGRSSLYTATLTG